jgi:RNA polymerase sigma-70 factor (ECF subfamily)
MPVPLAEALARQAGLGRTGLSRDEFTAMLCELGAKHNANLPASVEANPAQREAFWRSLHLRELALAHACARGDEAAWAAFLEEYRGPMRQAAMAITRSSSDGEELADSLYSELFGLTEREGRRWSPLASYSGRGSLMGWLRATLAQRHVDRHRAVHRETVLESDEIAAAASAPEPEAQTLLRLGRALAATLRALPAEERFLLAAYFLDGRTLLELARLERVHEATMSRRIRRLTDEVHHRLLKQLEADGMSRRAAQEALGTDPRDLTVNLRNLLQTSPGSAFLQQTGQQSTDQDRS